MGQIVLPTGIPEIINHLKSVDTVPLQVSLFSDANAKSTIDMIEIMQVINIFKKIF